MNSVKAGQIDSSKQPCYPIMETVLSEVSSPLQVIHKKKLLFVSYIIRVPPVLYAHDLMTLYLCLSK